MAAAPFGKRAVSIVEAARTSKSREYSTACNAVVNAVPARWEIDAYE
jgi:hypothetical protein